jgi:hypothetical protein
MFVNVLEIVHDAIDFRAPRQSLRFLAMRGVHASMSPAVDPVRNVHDAA